MTTPRARKENGSRAFERLLDATTAQTRVMTSMLEVQRATGGRMEQNSESVAGLAGLIEKQTAVLAAMESELKAGGPRTTAAVQRLEAHVTLTSLLSDRKVRNVAYIVGAVALLASLLGGGAAPLLETLLKLKG
jgi:phage-related tail protein